MGMMEQIKNVVGTFLGGAPDSSSKSVMNGISELITQQGGITALAQKFQSGGFGEIMKSWISTGKNLPISAAQIQSALGSQTVKNLATKMGVSPETASAQLSQYLPAIIDKLTPNGQVPSQVNASQILSAGMDFLKKKTN
jgi:uncharacterized protein YidB (DUF937 family)